MKLIAGDYANQAVPKWVAERIPFVGDRGFGACTAIGVIGNDGRPLAGIVFHDYQPTFSTICFSIAADSPRWVTRRLIGSILVYPFEELKLKKLWTATPHRNERALRLAKGLGFTREAVLAHHFGKEHAVINRMFFKDYIRLYGVKSGNRQDESSAAA